MFFSQNQLKRLICISYLYNCSLNMSKRTKTANIKAECSGTKPKVIKEEETPVPFSPKVTRNRKKIKLEYEKSEPKLERIESTVQKVPKFEPPLWRQTLENIRSMRKKHPAPVDTMGCDQCSDNKADDKTQRYHCLLSLMLSSQTKDQITYDAMKRLKERTESLTPVNLLKLSDFELEDLLKPVSFYKTKAKHMKIASQMLVEQYDCDIPNTIEGLLKLPGVGKKMAYLAMTTAWHKVEGIGVDTHVHRIANWLKWVEKPTKSPEDTRVALEAWLPRELWNEINHLLVGFGQTVCTAKNPGCETCDNADICPARVVPKAKKITKKVKKEEVKD